MAIQSPDISAQEFRIRAEICMPSLLILAAAIDHVGTKRFPEFFLGPKESRAITINPKPLQLLTKLASENKKLKVVAAEMGITESTANDHMAAVKKALGAPTQASAVYLAIKEGLIDSPWQSY